MNKQEYIKTWSEKLSIPIEEIEMMFSTYFENEKEVHSDLNEEQLSERALRRLALTYKKQLRSPAVGFEGFIIGVGDCVDIVARQRREALELFKTEPQTAINDGITNEEGVPLDTRKEWSEGRANPQYGKPLPDNNFLRNVFGIAIKAKTETPKFFTMTINGEKATNEDIPLFAPVRFVAIDKNRKGSQETQTSYQLNASQFTNFVVDEKINLPNFKEILTNLCGITPIKSLGEYHNSHKEEFNRVVITEGDVSSLNLEPTAFGSRVMVIEDISTSIEDIESKGVTCWLPLRADIDFAEGSKVLVIGRTSQGKKKDNDGKITEELGDITINAYGIYALPEYKISLPELQEITEENLELE